MGHRFLNWELLSPLECILDHHAGSSETGNWKQCVALGRRGAAATTASADLPSRGGAARCQILHLHLCPCGSEALQAVLAGKPHPFTTTWQSLTMLRRFFPWLFLLWGFWAVGEAIKQWLLNWWLGSHNYFSSDQCCRLWARVSVTGKYAHEVQSLKGNGTGSTQTTVLPLSL